MDTKETKRVVIPNLIEGYIDAQVKVLKIQDKIENLRAKGNFKSMGKVINDELLKASIKRNKALTLTQKHLDAIAAAKAKE